MTDLRTALLRETDALGQQVALRHGASILGEARRRRRNRLVMISGLTAVLLAGAAAGELGVVTKPDSLQGQFAASEGFALEEYEGGHVLFEGEGPGKVERVDFPAFLRNDTKLDVTILSMSVSETDLVGYVKDVALASGARLPLGFTRQVTCSGPVLPQKPRVLIVMRLETGEERRISLPLTDTVTFMYRNANACDG